MLLDLGDDVDLFAAAAAVRYNADRAVDLGKPGRELDVDHRSDDLDDFACFLRRCCLCHNSLSGTSVPPRHRSGTEVAYVAAAPDTTSMISRVMAACLTLFI